MHTCTCTLLTNAPTVADHLGTHVHAFLQRFDKHCDNGEAEAKAAAALTTALAPPPAASLPSKPPPPSDTDASPTPVSTHMCEPAASAAARGASDHAPLPVCFIDSSLPSKVSGLRGAAAWLIEPVLSTPVHRLGFVRSRYIGSDSSGSDSSPFPASLVRSPPPPVSCLHPLFLLPHLSPSTPTGCLRSLPPANGRRATGA